MSTLFFFFSLFSFGPDYVVSPTESLYHVVAYRDAHMFQGMLMRYPTGQREKMTTSASDGTPTASEADQWM
jgi:hypothetical protein